MKIKALFIIVVTGIVITCFAFSESNRNIPSDNSKGFVLIELFSSEGCSSCPPAESFMHKLIHRADSASLPVYIIEFHVDYWNYLGWKDTLAIPAYAQRQQKYGDAFKLSSIYTPQAIINGESEMVGSDEGKINSIILQHIQQPTATGVSFKVNKIGPSKIEAEYSLTGNTSGCELNFVLVESDLITHIKRGENAGKTITHDNVARVFKTIKIDSYTGKITIETPHVNLANSMLICFVQNIDSRKVIAATQLKIQ